MKIRTIEIVFPVAVDLENEDQRVIDEIISRVCRRYVAENPGRTMWLFGVGYKPTYIPMTKEEEDAGRHMEFDETTFQIEVAEREDYDWRCRKCGMTQSEHALSGSVAPAGRCEYDPRSTSDVIIFVNGDFHPVPANSRLDYETIFALEYPGRAVAPGATVTYCWRGKGDINRAGTIYPGKTVRPLDGMQVNICFTGNA